MNTFFHIPISKRDEEQQMVYGYASTPEMDTQGEVVTTEALKKALPDYLKFPTIREMHQPVAVGVTKQAEIRGENGMYIGAKVVDKAAWEKVKEGVYRAFSIGGKVLRQEGNKIVDLVLTEVSLVDSPANKGAVIEIYKRDDRASKLLQATNELVELIQKGDSMSTKDKKIKKDDEVIEEKEIKAEEAPVEEETAEKDTIEEEAVEEKTASDTSDMTKLEKMEAKLSKEVADDEEEVEKMDKSEMISTLQKQSQRIESLSGVVEKMTSVLESVVDRVSQVEAQPAAPKTKTSFVVENKTVTKSETAEDKRTQEIHARLEELRKIRGTNLVKYQTDFQSEAFELMDELAALSK